MLRTFCRIGLFSAAKRLVPGNRIVFFADKFHDAFLVFGEVSAVFSPLRLSRWESLRPCLLRGRNLKKSITL